MDKIAVLIPCYNEALTIGKVIEDFKRHLPSATIYVYDNNSTDDTYAIASSYKGVIVRRSPKQGKGAVVQHMFRDIEAAVYLMVDGDATYPARFAKRLVCPIIKDKCDMVIGDRLSSSDPQGRFRPFHGFGNKLVRFLVNKLFNGNLSDIMTGYRAMSRWFVKSVSLNTDGFEIETEMSIKAIRGKYKLASTKIDFLERPEGSQSKLNTVSDGFKVLKLIFKMKLDTLLN